MITKSDINEGNFSFDDLDKLINRIAELEAECRLANDKFLKTSKRLSRLEDSLAIRDLEQQAKGVREFVDICKNSLDWDWLIMVSASELFDMMRIRSKKLREQAKALKKGAA